MPTLDILKLLNQLEEGIILTNYLYEPWFMNVSAQKSLALKDVSDWKSSPLLTHIFEIAPNTEKAYFLTEELDQEKFFIYKEKIQNAGFKFVIAKVNKQNPVISSKYQFKVYG